MAEAESAERQKSIAKLTDDLSTARRRTGDETMRLADVRKELEVRPARAVSCHVMSGRVVSAPAMLADSACLPPCLPPFRPSCLPACLPACLPTCLNRPLAVCVFIWFWVRACGCIFFTDIHRAIQLTDEKTPVVAAKEKTPDIFL